MKRWLIRNRWALVALPVVLVLSAWVTADAYRDDYHGAQPREPVAVDADGWASLGATRYRWVDVADPAALTSDDGTPVEVQAGTHLVRADVAITAPADADTVCEISLVDDHGRRFTASPPQLGDAVAASLPADCTPSDRSAFWFVVPDAARPRQLRIVVLTALPRYVLLARPAS